MTRREHVPALTELLLKWGSDVTLKDDDGDTAWDLAETQHMKTILACIILHYTKYYKIIQFKCNKNYCF